MKANTSNSHNVFIAYARPQVCQTPLVSTGFQQQTKKCIPYSISEFWLFPESFFHVHCFYMCCGLHSFSPSLKCSVWFMFAYYSFMFEAQATALRNTIYQTVTVTKSVEEKTNDNIKWYVLQFILSFVYEL